MDVETFDYVVVGGGSAGCVMAARLSESGRHRVALLEAGGEDDNFWIRTPLGFGKLFEDPRYNWLYESEPEPELNGGKVFQPRGKVLGGTGSINGLIYVRGQREDFDHWRQLGNAGWGYDEVLPWFKKAEDNVWGASEFHGAGGPLGVADSARHPIADAFIEAGVEAGYARNDDFNGATQAGFGYNQINTRNGRRCSAATAYLHPARGRPNLSVKTNALATRILFRDRQATGVEFTREGVAHSVAASREVIVCGGSFNSPALLQSSGVGPADLLVDLGIPVVADVPGVGSGMEDHFGVAMTYRCPLPITINDYVNNPLRRLTMGARYLLFHSGPMSSNASLAGGCIRTSPSVSTPDVKIQISLWHLSATQRTKATMGLSSSSGFTVTMTLLRPESRGSVRIDSAVAGATPKIRFNFFASDGDRATALAALRVQRIVMQQPALSPYIAEELTPGPQASSDDDLVAYCRQRGRSSFHATSTCRMGNGGNDVVDARLRVRDVGRLRVVDASIMPHVVSGNTNAATIMIGEKGASMILEDAR